MRALHSPAAAAIALPGCGGADEPSAEPRCATPCARSPPRSRTATTRGCATTSSRPTCSRAPQSIGLPCEVAMRTCSARLQDPKLTVGAVAVKGKTAAAEIKTSADGPAALDGHDPLERLGPLAASAGSGARSRASPTPSAAPTRRRSQHEGGLRFARLAAYMRSSARLRPRSACRPRRQPRRAVGRADAVGAQRRLAGRQRPSSSSRTHSSSPPRRNAAPCPATAALSRPPAGQQLVAGGVAEAVVVGLEAVEVEQGEQPDLALVEDLLQRLHQRAPVGELCQRVGALAALEVLPQPMTTPAATQTVGMPTIALASASGSTGRA